jgi:hypothetical protein
MSRDRTDVQKPKNRNLMRSYASNKYLLSLRWFTGRSIQLLNPKDLLSELLKETFFPTPPEADLQDIRGIAYDDQIDLPSITERGVHQAILETPSIKPQDRMI